MLKLLRRFKNYPAGILATELKAFLVNVPSEMAKLERLSYTSPLELLAEKFHMDSNLLRKMNEGNASPTWRTSVRSQGRSD